MSIAAWIIIGFTVWIVLIAAIVCFFHAATIAVAPTAKQIRDSFEAPTMWGDPPTELRPPVCLDTARARRRRRHHPHLHLPRLLTRKRAAA